MRFQPLSVLLIALLSSHCSSPRSGGADGDLSPAPTSSSSESPGTRLDLASFALGYQADERGADRIIAKAQAVTRGAPGKAGSYTQLAEAFLVRRRETADASYLAYARDALSAARTLSPEDSRVLTTQIMLYFDDHRFADAAGLARRVIAADRDDAGGYLLLSDAELELGRYDAAVEALQEAMDRSPDLRSYSRAAYLRWLHGDVEGAIESMNDALAASSRSPEPMAWCYVELGTMLWHAGQLSSARRAAEQALILVSEYAPALSLQARILAAQGQPEAAMKKLAAVIERAPSAEILLRASDLAATSGHTAESERWRAEAEKLASHDPVPVALYYARHGIEIERAVELAEKAVTGRATVYTQDAHAMALLRAGRIAEAGKAMERALALETADARLLLHRGLIELASGDRAAARASLFAANARNPHADPRLAAELERGVTGKGRLAVNATAQ